LRQERGEVNLSNETNIEGTSLPFAVTMKLLKNGHFLSEVVAETENDLYCGIEMDAGTGWLDAADLYHRMVDKKREQIAKTFSVCHSYEKWGEMQQEVVKIRVKLRRLAVASPALETPTPAPVATKEVERIDTRGEWFREWDTMCNTINVPPRWYRVGMVLSGIWILFYLVTYPIFHFFF
jgi:hypothetical protein